MDLLYSLFTGVIVGSVFALLKMPIPAPNNLAGILGIAGIFIGMLLVKFFFK